MSHVHRWLVFGDLVLHSLKSAVVLSHSSLVVLIFESECQLMSCCTWTRCVWSGLLAAVGDLLESPVCAEVLCSLYTTVELCADTSGSSR